MDQESLGGITKIISSIFEQVKAAPAHLLLILVLFVLGAFLKASPITNRAIPYILIGLGTVLYPLLASPGNVDPSFRFPSLVLALYGLLLGVGAIVLHMIAKRSEKFRQLEAGFVNAFKRDEGNAQQKE
jgi:hypothetical protein